MAKSDINLLPPVVIAERVRRIYLQRAGRLYGVLVIGIVLLLLVYGGVGWILWNLNQDLASEQGEVDEEAAQVRSNVRSINSLLAAMDRDVKMNTPWVAHIQEALAVAPEGVVIREVELRQVSLPSEETEQFVELSGDSGSRSAVVAFEQALAELDWLERVESPLKNLASGETVAFSFSLYRVPGGEKEDSL